MSKVFMVEEPQVGEIKFLRQRNSVDNNEITCETCDANGPNCDCSDPGTGSDSCACEDN